MKQLKFRIASLILVMIAILPVVVSAQDGPPGFGNDVSDVGGGAGVPIDGGLGLLVAAGVGYGVKKYADRRKSVREDQAKGK